MFLPLAIALHTLDHKRGGNNENRVLLQVSKPNRCERSFQICKVDLKFGVDMSSPIPHLNTKDVAKKIRMSTWKWHPNAKCPTHRVKVQLTHLSRDIQRYVVISKKIHNHHEHSETTPNIAVAILTHIWFPRSQPAYRSQLRMLSSSPESHTCAHLSREYGAKVW